MTTTPHSLIDKLNVKKNHPKQFVHLLELHR